MTDFVLNKTQQYLDDFITLTDFNAVISNYANLLRQPLTLGMFVPIDENGNVLEEPYLTMEESREIYDIQDTYSKAKDKVLFEGFTGCDRGMSGCVVLKEEHFHTWKGKNVEYMTNFLPVTLTPSALKQIYGC